MLLPRITSLLLAALWAATFAPLAASEPDTEGARYFEQHVRPLLARRCHKCHGPDKQKSELRLDSRKALLAGGESGPAVVPGKPAESLLVEAIRYESFEMPPDGQLAESEIALLTRWVEIGAPWPEESAALRPRDKITEEDRQWWAFRPIADPAVPEVEDNGWSKNEIDRFVFRRLAAENLRPAAEADRRTLARRAYLDLHGLPPTAAQIEQFVGDDAPGAWPRLVDRLLDSPRYGERWARHWLDLVRYAESDGYRQDAYRPHAWRYRDWVIGALNADMPYDRFVQFQLAGDEIAPDDPQALVATGFLRHGQYEYNQRDALGQWTGILDEITDVTGDVFLGMSIGCARCHDHKFDPVPRDDYYRLRAFFAPLRWRQDLTLATPDERTDYAARLAKWESETAAIRAKIDAIEAPYRKTKADGAVNKFPADIQAAWRKAAEERSSLDQQLADLVQRQIEEEWAKIGLSDAHKKEVAELKKELAAFDAMKPGPLPPVLCATDTGTPISPTRVPGRDDGPPIEPGFLTVLAPGPAAIERPAAAPHSSGRRAALARWLTRPDHPVTARVIVNRVWQHHFGQGLVATPSEFGQLGEPPSHPELLDWLAARFIEDGWSLKSLHRRIMNSSTYRQSATGADPERAMLVDPRNRLLWRASVRRLAAEQVRDALLLASGELDLKVGGPSSAATSNRRSIYTKIVRNTRDPLLELFDAPDGLSSAARRNVTTTPSQALLLINGPWVLGRAGKLAERIEKASPNDDANRAVANRAVHAWRLAYGREPTSEEGAAAVAFLTEQAEAIAGRDDAAPPARALVAMPGRESRAVDVRDGRAEDMLHLADRPELPSGDFTVEAIVLLRSLYPSANVRVICSQWEGNPNRPGWSLGVTSEKSKYQPRNLIVQLVGDKSQGAAGYEVIASDLRPELNRPYYVGVSIDLDEKSERGVTFFIKDLSRPGAPLLTSSVAHNVTSHYRAAVPLVVGGRHKNSGQGNPGHGWDGLIDAVRISSSVLPRERLLIYGAPTYDDTVALWQFEEKAKPLADGSKNGHDLETAAPTPPDPKQAARTALVDLCHALLNSSEFLYVQ